ncbi:hypothetical protein KBC70_02640 [Candidatus Woesebacteria bacterium]|nr:hypothetical protein [Candidatus Woesebacteria bacterium]
MSNSTMMANSQVTQLLEGAAMLSQQSMGILRPKDVGNSIRDAMGKPVLNSASTDVLLVAMMLDDSGSICFGSNEQAVRDGTNSVVESLKDAREAVDIQFFLRYLNGTIMHPFGDLDTVPLLTSANYRGSGGTPLYDQSVEFLKALIAKAQEFEQYNVNVRTMSLIVTDGQDAGSFKHRAADVCTIVKDLLATESHIVAGMGVDGGGTNFRDIFADMGIPDMWIYETGPMAGESKDEFLRRIRRGFQLFSKSAVRASKSAVNFSQLGGFGMTTP